MAEEKKGMLDRIKSSRLGKALFVAGAMAGATFGMADKAEAAETKAEVAQPKAKVEAQVDQKAEFNQRIKVDLKANQARIQISGHVKPMEPAKNLEDKIKVLQLRKVQAARHRDQATVKAIQAEIDQINAQIIQQAEASRQQGGDER